jgi:hypothetical protein
VSSLILSLGAKRRWVVDVTYRSQYPEQRTPVLNEEDAGWVPQLNWTFWTKHKSLAPAAIPTPDLLAHRLQGIPNTIRRLNNTLFFKHPPRLPTSFTPHSILPYQSLFISPVSPTPPFSKTPNCNLFLNNKCHYTHIH